MFRTRAGAFHRRQAEQARPFSSRQVTALCSSTKIGEMLPSVKRSCFRVMRQTVASTRRDRRDHRRCASDRGDQRRFWKKRSPTAASASIFFYRIGNRHDGGAAAARSSEDIPLLIKHFPAGEPATEAAEGYRKLDTENDGPLHGRWPGNLFASCRVDPAGVILCSAIRSRAPICPAEITGRPSRRQLSRATRVAPEWLWKGRARIRGAVLASVNGHRRRSRRKSWRRSQIP